MDLITIIVPCYNEEEALPAYYSRMKAVKTEIKADVRLLFIDDGSRDGTLEFIKKLAMDDGSVSYISFSKNFGKEAAIYAGIKHAQGDYIAIMDADLQDPPEILAEMYERLLETGVDCAAARRTNRKGEPPIRSFFATRFYKLINKISKTELVNGARDFRLFTRRMADSILEMGERCRFSKGIFSWVGYRTEWIEYQNVERVAGVTKWSFASLFVYALEGIIAFSAAPLALPIVFGMIMLLAALILLINIVVFCISGVSLSPALLLSFVIVTTSGMMLLGLGILCGYIAKIYWEVKGRPIYIIKEKSND